MQCSAADNEEGKDGEAGGSGYDEAQQVMMMLHAADHKIATVAPCHPASHDLLHLELHPGLPQLKSICELLD